MTTLSSLAAIVDAAGDTEFHGELCDWLDANVPDGIDKPGYWPRDRTERRKALQRWQAVMADAGWAGISWPVQFGGRDASLAQQMIYHAEMSARSLPGLIGHRGLSIVGPSLIRHGSAEQQSRFLERIRRGDDLWVSGWSEPEAGSDLASLRTRAEVVGDEVVVNGQKVWTSQAMEFDWMFAMVRTDPALPKHDGISIVLIPLDAHGLTRRPIQHIAGTQDFCEVFFDNVTVPVGNIVGEINRGWTAARTTLAHEHFTNFIPAQMRYARTVQSLAEAARSAKQPDGCPRAELPEVREALGRAWSTSQLMLINGLRNIAHVRQGDDPGPEGSIMKVFGQEAERDLFEAALQIVGPRSVLGGGREKGILNGRRWQQAYLKARASTIGGGTSEIHRNKISEGVLGMPRESYE